MATSVGSCADFTWAVRGCHVGMHVACGRVPSPDHAPDWRLRVRNTPRRRLACPHACPALVASSREARPRARRYDARVHEREPSETTCVTDPEPRSPETGVAVASWRFALGGGRTRRRDRRRSPNRTSGPVESQSDVTRRRAPWRGDASFLARPECGDRSVHNTFRSSLSISFSSCSFYATLPSKPLARSHKNKRL